MGGVTMKNKKIQTQLPFQVGQSAESKSFLEGFRSAWFRCKIRKIASRKGQTEHKLEFFDFPDEELRWTKLYEKSPYEKLSTVTISTEETEMELMVRPSYPPIFHESEIPETSKISEVIVIVDNVWKVGDLVDWLKDGCYWSGEITHVISGDKVKIALPEPPIGEGSSYPVSFKDLRPSLDWSLEHGWTVPISKKIRSCRCARLINPVDGDNGNGMSITRGAIVVEAGMLLESNPTSISSHGSARSLRSIDKFSSPSRKKFLKQPVGSLAQTDELLTPVPVVNSEIGYHQSGHPCSSDKVSSAQYDLRSSCKPSKKHKISVDSQASAIESSIVELEELANKIKWLKRVHQFGIQYSNAVMPEWKFVDAPASR